MNKVQAAAAKLTANVSDFCEIMCIARPHPKVEQVIGLFRAFKKDAKQSDITWQDAISELNDKTYLDVKDIDIKNLSQNQKEIVQRATAIEETACVSSAAALVRDYLTEVHNYQATIAGQ